MNFERRKLIQLGATALLASRSVAAMSHGVPNGPQATHAGIAHEAYKLPALPLPAGIRERYVPGVNGLTIHILEAGYDSPQRPAILLLHGFPEIAYSWRTVILPLAAAGYHVIAPDLRGYGRTTGSDNSYDGDVDSFRTHNLARDAIGLVVALGHTSVRTVVGHDVGAAVAAYCALVRPDFFRSVVLTSVPFGGPPALPVKTRELTAVNLPKTTPFSDPLAALPVPRKDSSTYFSSRNANDDILHARQGLHDFQRAYFHVKSADFKKNRPFPLASGVATELARQPTYYVMDLNKTMPETVAPDMPSVEEIAACQWLPDVDLAVYTQEYRRTGFQGGLNWFRCATGGINRSDLELYSGRTIDVPSCFVSGSADWARFRPPGALDKMRTEVCTDFKSFTIIDGAGHWVQQEQSERYAAQVIQFLSTV
jgi:pimeloyl-ACP methyl ester carboxylesterase